MFSNILSSHIKGLSMYSPICIRKRYLLVEEAPIFLAYTVS